jgi:hypothetical protein
MKLQITEEQLKTIINNLSEQVVLGRNSDPWQYKKNGNRYFVAKKNSNSWKEVFGNMKKAVEKMFGGKEEDDDAIEKTFKDKEENDNVISVTNNKDFKNIEISDTTNKNFVKKIDPKRLSSNSSVTLFSAGQPECAQFVNDFSNSINFVGNAWTAHDNRSLGSLVYSVFDSVNDDIKNNIIDLWKKIDAKGGGVKSGPYKSQVSNLVSKLVGTSSFSNLKLGDVVGIYYPPSKWHEFAFYNAGEPYFIDSDKKSTKSTSRKVMCSKTVVPLKCDQGTLDLQVTLNDTCGNLSIKLKEDGQRGTNTNNAIKVCKSTSVKNPGKTISGGESWGMNTHIGIVGAIKDGVPLVFHNIHGQVFSDPPNKLHDGGKIAWVRRPQGIIARTFWSFIDKYF